MLLGFPAAALTAFGIAHPTAALAAGSTSAQVAYVTDSSNGGFSLWVDGLGVVAPADGGTYSTHTPAAALSVTIHNVAMTALDTANSTALNGIDTAVLYSVCDLAAHPNALKAVNAFFDGGGKLIILDGAQCVNGNGGTPDYSGFSKPFSVNYTLPIPQYGSAPYTAVEASTLTTGLPDCTPAGCNEPGNSVADANLLNAFADGWCKSLGGTTTNGPKGAVEAYSRNKSGTGLAIYNGEPYTYSGGTTAQHNHARLVFDDMLTQAWNADGLPCGSALKTLNVTPTSDNPFAGVNETVSAKVTDGAANPVSGVVVHFAVGSGPNAGTNGNGTTDATGVATFVYTSTKTGTDTVTATFSDANDHVSNPSKVAWQAAPPPSIAETHSAILVPVIGLLLAGAALLLTTARRRRRTVGQTQ